MAAAIGVWFAYAQLRHTRQQAITQFEDGLAREYREIARRIPVRALLGEDLERGDFEKVLNDLYNYIDLTNEQVFLRRQGRVRAETWNNWRDGIRTNLSRPAFQRAWERIKRGAPDSFEELRLLERSGFTEDPHDWEVGLASTGRKAVTAYPSEEGRAGRAEGEGTSDATP